MPVRTTEKKQRKFINYESLRMALTRSDIQDPGTTAHLLLELFLESGGKLYAQNVVNRCLCKGGKFKEWRDEMVKKGWLEFRYDDARKNNNFSQHYPGKKLLNYINKEKILTKELVTSDQIIPKEDIATKADLDRKADKSELEETRRQLEATHRKMQEIAAAVRELQEAMLPPDSPQKESVRKKSAQKIASLSTVQ
jgi:hypothetical protein